MRHDSAHAKRTFHAQWLLPDFRGLLSVYPLKARETRIHPPDEICFATLQETRSDWLRLPHLLGDYWTRLNKRPPRSTPTTAPLLSRLKKPRCPLRAPSVVAVKVLVTEATRNSVS